MPEPRPDLTNHLAEVWRTVYRLLGNTEDARECLQQTFVDAMRIDLDTVQSWRAVLCQIATRRAMDLLRKRYRERGSFEPLIADPTHDDPPNAALDYKELCHRVRESLAALPDLQGEAFWLRHIEQWSPGEISRELGIETGHVRVLVHRAVKHLQQTLNHESRELLSRRGGS
ncbi:MAG: sigma-70 family RNA polymerase sigma factor [Planctomycetota bacterium]